MSCIIDKENTTAKNTTSISANHSIQNLPRKLSITTTTFKSPLKNNTTEIQCDNEDDENDNSHHHDKKPKPLKSCIRCRKNKIKCDSIVKRPGPCSSCLKKNLKCELDYVVKPQRGKELKGLYDNLHLIKNLLKDTIDYQSNTFMFLSKFGSTDINASSINTNTTITTNIHTKFIKLKLPHSTDSISTSSVKGEDPRNIENIPIANNSYIYIAFKYDDKYFYVNNFIITLDKLNDIFHDFNKVLSSLLQLYENWSTSNSKAKKSLVYDWKTLFHSNQLLLLYCILNFYLDIPQPNVNLSYLQLFNYIVNDYTTIASSLKDDISNGVNATPFCSTPPHKNVANVIFDQIQLSKLIVGITQDGSISRFHSEIFIKNFTLYLFFHIVLYGPDYFMDVFMNKYIKILEYLRKKINFEKNWEIKLCNFYVKIWNLITDEGYSKASTVNNIDKSFEFNFCDDDTPLFLFMKFIKFDKYILHHERNKHISRFNTQNFPDHSQFSRGISSLISNLQPIFQILTNFKTRRLNFIIVFFTQFVVLNVIMVINNNSDNNNDGSGDNNSNGNMDCNKYLFLILESFKYNGFNHILMEEQYDNSISRIDGCYYSLQHRINEFKNKTNGTITDNDIVGYGLLELMELSLGEHFSVINPDLEIYSLILKDLQNYNSDNNSSLYINKASCQFIYYFYKKVIYEDMFEKVYGFKNTKNIIVFDTFVFQHNGFQIAYKDERIIQPVVTSADYLIDTSTNSKNDSHKEIAKCDYKQNDSNYVITGNNAARTNNNNNNNKNNHLTSIEVAETALNFGQFNANDKFATSIAVGPSKSSTYNCHKTNGTSNDRETKNLFGGFWKIENDALLKGTDVNTTVESTISNHKKKKSVRVTKDIGDNINNSSNNITKKKKKTVHNHNFKDVNTNNESLNNKTNNVVITNVLDRVDWIKDSTDEVLQKIHGVL
ncbi:Zn(II)2Cys6 transcription factor domain-containing protein SCDLUD_004054 [Saccharomycodes ludwigii]|uniref:Zn(II)2Cys6 transcription factor domain-containing protein n=1 Tax=Saccharomycodes ludwigii TaxID=36035 RepID=UPI001E8B2DC3|nr:hypothetical protein SCDLUD_004054 [Saccharomycodes ludwigii]KAH3899766.1 hypothetical protein SCDLUD_004054 [Saccharomycodes ludwigii]